MDKTAPQTFDTFSTLFLVMQQLQYISDRELASDGLTTKQWLLLIAITRHPEQAPSMKEAAEYIATSHQNVKQIATLLENKGFITITRDQKDRRSLRLKTTAKFDEFTRERLKRQSMFLDRVFGGFREDEAETFHSLVNFFSSHIANLYRENRA